MQTKRWGASAASVPVIGQGTWQMEQGDRPRAIAALRAGLDEGMTHIDTAELYGDGRVEELVGEAIEGRREEVFLVSKVVPAHATRAGTIRACEASLKRLRTEWLDGYLIHWLGPHPLEETLGAFHALQQAGKVRTFGVSNFDSHLLDRAVAIAGPGAIACNQVLYHLGDRTIERDVLPACERHGVTLVGYSPFGGAEGFPAEHPVLASIAAARGLTPRQVALAFLARDPSVLAIPKAADPRHARANAGAGRITLDEEARAAIERAFPVGPWRGLPTA